MDEGDQKDRSCEKWTVKVSGERNILHTVRGRNSYWIGHVLFRNCLLNHVIERKIEERVEVMAMRGRRRKQLPETSWYCTLKDEALLCTLEKPLWKRLWTCRKTDYGMFLARPSGPQFVSLHARFYTCILILRCPLMYAQVVHVWGLTSLEAIRLDILYMSLRFHAYHILRPSPFTELYVIDVIAVYIWCFSKIALVQKLKWENACARTRSLVLKACVFP